MRTIFLTTLFVLFTLPVFAQGDYTDPATLPGYTEVSTAPQTTVYSEPCNCEKEMKVVADIVRNPVEPTPDTSKAKTEWWQILLDNLLQIVFSILGIVVIPLIKNGVDFINTKRNWHIQSEVLENLATNGIAYAEEVSRKSVLHNGGQKTPGAQKMDLALNFVKTNLEASGFTKDVKMDLTQFIESKLHSVRPLFQQIAVEDAAHLAGQAIAGGTGATGCNAGCGCTGEHS